MSDLGNRTEFYYDFYADNRKVHKLQKYFYVDAALTGTSANWSGRRHEAALPTLAAAYSACTASRGDRIIVSPFHTETTTAVLTASKIGVSIEGQVIGNRRPIITGNSTADTISLTAASQTVSGLRFAAPSTDAQTSDINVAAANCKIENTLHIGATTDLNKVDIITIASGGDDLLIDGARIYNAVVEVVGGIVLEAAVARPEIRNCFVYDAIGFTDGCLSDEAAATACYIHHNVWMNAKAATVVLNFVTNSTGTCSFNHIVGRHTTIASNVVAGTGMNFFENRVVEEAALGGLISVPTVDVD